jgi:hypothetical protein
MSQTASDRNLLFGIIALQMDFITRDALIAGMNAWILAKDKPLGQLLVEQGALAHDERALLDPLVRKHLQKHGEDAERSLSALSPLGWIKLDLQAFADPEVDVSLLHPSHENGADSQATWTHAAGASSSHGGRFRILGRDVTAIVGECDAADDDRRGHRHGGLYEPGASGRTAGRAGPGQ